MTYLPNAPISEKNSTSISLTSGESDLKNSPKKNESPERTKSNQPQQNLTDQEREKLIDLYHLKDRSQQAYNKLTCLHGLSPYHRDLLLQEMTALDEEIIGKEAFNV